MSEPTFPAATLPPSTATSTDGTTIAYDAHGDGPVVVVVGGATNTRMAAAGLAAALEAAGLTGVVYDRRGRGDSGDTAPYAVQREVEDLAAVIDAVRPGGSATLVGFSSGAALVLRAVVGGAPVERAVTFEPPYRVEGSPPLPADYTGTLERLCAEGRNGDAYEFFLTRAVGLPQEMADVMKRTPVWDMFTPLAPTLAYDGHCLGGDEQPFPTDLVTSIGVPVLALASTGSPSWLQEPARMVGDAAPDGRFELVEGEFHTAPDEVLAGLVAAFVRG